MSSRRYQDLKPDLQRSIQSAIKNIVENDPECKKVIDENKQRIAALKQFAKDYDVQIISNQYYCMSAKTRRVLKTNIEEVVRTVVDRSTGDTWWY